MKKKGCGFTKKHLKNINVSVVTLHIVKHVFIFKNMLFNFFCMSFLSWMFERGDSGQTRSALWPRRLDSTCSVRPKANVYCCELVVIIELSSCLNFGQRHFGSYTHLNEFPGQTMMLFPLFWINQVVFMTKTRL